MSKYLVLTTTGHDRLGIVEEITELLLEYDANVEASRMARLGGEFAMLMLISVPGKKIEALREAVRSLRQADYKVTTRLTQRGEAAKYAGYVPYEINVKGADHVGIIHNISRYLTEQGVNIETMDTEVHKAPMSGALLFTMEAIVFVPPALSYQDLRESLEHIGDELGVDTEVAPHVG